MRVYGINVFNKYVKNNYDELHGPKTRKRENAKIDFRVSKLHRELQET
jgi:hypothetical protein